MRCAIPRLVELFKRFDVPVAAAINASVIETYPALAQAIHEAGWEFMGHGWTQRSLQQEDDEVAVIHKCVAKIADFTGRPPRGWLGAGLHETEHTPEHLKDAGIEYVSDWVLDDLPCWMTTAKGRLIAMPYSLELNDTVIYAIEKHEGAEIFNRVSNTVSVFEQEFNANPRVMTIALHPYAIGAPHRLPHLERVLRMLKERSDTIFMNGAEIADWFTAASPTQAIPPA
jgi:peptidoglycan/xylan/chitin deacetylase (PgdA/CDA1 family)